MMSIKNIREGKRGFTLVEMAIVLVIIGIILAGVMKGRDIVRGSQVKQFSQGFAQKWVTIASTYYDKKGQPLCDGTENGGNATEADGRMDGLMMAIAAGGETGITARRDAIITAVRNVGITPCTMIKSDLEDSSNECGTSNGYNVFERTVDGEFLGKRRVGVGFYNYTIGTAGPNRNVVVLQNVPVDVAVGLDTVIDGQADGENGNCVALAVTTDATGTTNVTAPASSAAVTLSSWFPGTPTNSERGMACVGLILDY